MKQLPILIICLSVATAGYAEMYQWVDQQGVRHFSNTIVNPAGQDVAITDEIQTTGAAKPPPAQRHTPPPARPAASTSTSQPAPTPNRETQKAAARHQAAIQKAQQRVAMLEASTQEAEAVYKRTHSKKRKFHNYRKYMEAKEKLTQAQKELNDLMKKR